MIAAAAALAALALAAGPRFTVSDVPLPEGAIGGARFARIDGDALDDAVVAWPGTDGARELHVHLQRPDGAFPPQPDRKISLKADIVAFSIADVRPDPGEELIFFTAGACFSFSAARGDFAGNAARLFAFDLLPDMPDPKGVAFIEARKPAAGGPLWILPGKRGYAAFGRKPGDATGEIGQRAALAPGDAWWSSRRSRRAGISIGGKPERFAGLVSVPGAGESRLLHLERWMPNPVLADADGDGRADICFLDKTAAGRVLHIHLQREDGGFAEAASWTGPIPEDGPLEVADIDGDGRADLIAAEPEGSGSRTFRFFRNRGARFDSAKPDGLMKFSGYGVEARPLDLDGDGKPELVVSSYEVPAAGAVAGGRVVRRLFVYRADPEAVFARRPALQHEETFTAKDVKGIGLRANFDGDLLGRGVRDAVSVERDGALVARHLSKDLSLEDEPFFRFAPEKWILGIEVRDLNGDGRSDLVLGHMRRMTILVSKP